MHAQIGSITAAYRPDFEYHATDAENGSITRGSSWTDAQLVSFGAGMLKETTDTVTVVKEPNAKGNNITLIAGAGIGSYNDPLVIDFLLGLDALTQEQKAALAAAERGDATTGGTIITVVQPRPVNVHTGSRFRVHFQLVASLF